MSRRHYNLPPLTTLSAFEAAARHLSFKDAAQELSVTPGAVSHQIKALEAELGAELFRRRHRGVELNADGELLFETLAGAFSRLSKTLQHIRQSGESDIVKIGSTSAVATLWLSGCLVRFWKENPNIGVNQVIQDWHFPGNAAIDMFVRYGQAPDQRLDQEELYRDRLVALGTPKAAERLRECSLDQLARERLIYLESDDRSWTTWTEWFRRLEYDGPVAQGITVNNYSVALQAAREGAGLVLGWQRLVSPMLRSGSLVAIGRFAVTAPHRFHLVSKTSSDLSESARKLRDWIIAEAREGTI